VLLAQLGILETTPYTQLTILHAKCFFTCNVQLTRLLLTKNCCTHSLR